MIFFRKEKKFKIQDLSKNSYNLSYLLLAGQFSFKR